MSNDTLDFIVALIVPFGFLGLAVFFGFCNFLYELLRKNGKTWPAWLMWLFHIKAKPRPSNEPIGKILSMQFDDEGLRGRLEIANEEIKKLIAEGRIKHFSLDMDADSIYNSIKIKRGELGVPKEEDQP